MSFSHSHVLVLGQPSDDLRMLVSVLTRLRCSTEIADSPAQMMLKAQQTPAHLVILSGNQHHWSVNLVQDLRTLANTRQATIVVLTDCHAPSWMPLEEAPGLDGFLVKPLSNDVVTSLVQSAWVRRSCCHEI